MTADNTPMPATEATCPPRSLWCVEDRRSCRNAGSCRSWKPNIDSASQTNTSANPDSTQGFCKAAAISVPEYAAATPAIA